MLCLVCQLFIISISAIDCQGRFVSEMTYHVSSGTLSLTKPNQLALPQHVRNAPSLSVFRRELKTVLFRSSFADVI